MIDNIGLFKEEEMALLFDQKRVKELSNNSRMIIKNMFGHVDENDLINCERVQGSMKPDLKFTINGETHYLSMKSGSNGIVHQEIVFNFCNHLRKIGISEYTVDTILLYHFGDGTKDGTGKKRYPYKRVMQALDKRIQYANQELNSNRDFVVHIVNRLIFKGSREDNILAEYVYHGDEEYGVIVSRKQVLMHAKNNLYSFMDNLHIGPLIMHPHARYVGKPVKSEKKRNTIEFHWANYFTSLRKIAVRYNSGNL